MNLKNIYHKIPNSNPDFSISIRLILLFSCFLFTSFPAVSKPKFAINYSYSLDGFVRIQIKNDTIIELACWVAIDGFKKKFRLPPYALSQWISANDKRFTYTSFSTWCDYLELHPEYKDYNRG